MFKITQAAVAAIDSVRNNPVVATATLMLMIYITPRSAKGLTGLMLQAGLPTFIAAAILGKFA